VESFIRAMLYLYMQHQSLQANTQISINQIATECKVPKHYTPYIAVIANDVSLSPLFLHL